MRASRGELTAALKRWADLRGDVATDVIEAVQPVVVLGDLSRELPYDPAIPWQLGVDIPAFGAGLHAVLALSVTERNVWLEVQGIHVSSNSAAQCAVRVNTGSEITANSAAVTVDPRRLRSAVDLGGLGAISAARGSTGIAPSGPYYWLRTGDGPPAHPPFAIGRADSPAFLNVVMLSANLSLSLSVWGRLHLLGAR